MWFSYIRVVPAEQIRTQMQQCVCIFPELSHAAHHTGFKLFATAASAHPLHPHILTRFELTRFELTQFIHTFNIHMAVNDLFRATNKQVGVWQEEKKEREK